MNSNLTTSERGKEFITVAEGVRYRAYLDTGGVWTIGVGHTGPEVVQGLQANKVQVQQWLTEDLKEAEDAIYRLVKVPLTQNQFDALASFVFNIGETQFESSTMLRKLNEGDYQGAANQFPRWVYDNGKQQPGLVKRRYGEKSMFLENG